METDLQSRVDKHKNWLKELELQLGTETQNEKLVTNYQL